MLAMTGFTWMVTFDIDGKQETFECVGHIGKGIESLKRVISDLYKTPKTKIKVIERWQEPLKEVCDV